MPGTDTSIWICSRNEKAGAFRRPPKLPQARRKQSVSEAVHPAHRYRLQGRAGEAGSPNKSVIAAILTIGGNAVAARAEVVMRASVIGLAGIDGIPVGLLVEMMLVADRVHVGRVVDRTHARITRRLPGMRPSEVDVVLTRDFLSERQPKGVVLPLVEVRIRGLAGEPLKNRVDDGGGQHRVLDAHLRRGFIGDTDSAKRSRRRRWRVRLIAGAVGVLVQLVRHDPVQRSRLIYAGH